MAGKDTTSTKKRKAGETKVPKEKPAAKRAKSSYFVRAPALS